MKIVIIGGRGNGTVVASTIEDCSDHEVVGFLNHGNDTEIEGYPVLGPPENWIDMDLDVYFIFTLSSVKVTSERYKLLKQLHIPEHRFASIIHPSAVVSKQAKIGKGVVMMPLVLVGPGVRIGNHSMLLGQSFIGHDTVLDEMVFVANNATIGGDIKIQRGAHIGSNSSILEHIIIQEYAVVGLGAVVVKDVSAYDVVVGNPAKTIRNLKGSK